MKLKITKDNIYQRIGDSIKIFDGNNSSIYTFNSTGTFIYEKLRKGQNSERIAKDLAQAFDTSTSQAIKDVNDFINNLLKIGLVNEEK